jgi:hypothetical protein
MTLAATGLPSGSWIRNPLAWLVGLMLAAALQAAGHSKALTETVVALAALALAGSFLAPAQEGVHRWIDIGPLHVNVAALLLPPTIVALAFAGIWRRSALAFAAAITALLVLQPDASQATSFLCAAVILLARSPAPRGARLAAIGVALLLAVAAWARPDPLQPVPEVEQIFSLALAVSPTLAAAAALALASVSLAPLAISSAAGNAERNAALALTGYFVSAAICPAFGAFPVPLVGFGMSFAVGHWLGIGLLCAKPRR